MKRQRYRLRFGRLACGLLGAISSVAAAQPDRAELMNELVRARKLSMALMTYSSEHDDAMPPDLGSLSPYLTGDLSKASSQERVKAIRESYVSELDGVKIPDNADEAWANTNSSFGYLGGAGIKISDLGDWGTLAVFHMKLDRGVPGPRTDTNPEGTVIPVVFVDGHVESLSRAEAERVIKESAVIFDAIKTGGPLPDSQQAQMDLRLVAGAIKAYAKANKGELPPTLGATLPFIPADSKRTATAKLRAAAYLSPEAKKSTHIPDEPTPEWVNERTTYVYLGSAGLQFGSIEDPGNSIIVHGKLDRPIEFKGRGGMVKGFAIGTLGGAAAVEEEEYARWMVDVSRRVIESAKTGAALPDHVNAHRDARLISQGISSYAKEHDGKLPGSLGEVLPYVLPAESAKVRAQVFLSPKGERITSPPDEVTAEWVNRWTSYTYLGGRGIDLKLAREAGVQILFHGPFAETYETRIPYGSEQVIASGTSYTYAWLLSVEQTEQHAKESKERLDALRAAAK